MKSIQTKKAAIIAAISLLLLIGVGTILVQTRRNSSQREQLAETEITQANPSPVAVGSPIPTPSPIPSPTPSPKPTPRPTIKPTPKVSPSPSVSPSPIAAPDFVFTDEENMFAGGNYYNYRWNDEIKLSPTATQPRINSVKVKNAGPVAGGKLNVTIIVDGKETTRLLDDNIDPGRTNEMGWGFDLDSGKGHHIVHIKINPDRKVTESDYSNNEVAFNYEVE